MEAQLPGGVGLVVFILLAVVLFVVASLVIFAKMYQRASKETSFVRTGVGGQRVIMNSGALVLPIFHEVIPVNMNTLRLEVRRANEQALITRDRMRVDVQAEFYVRVKPTLEAIADAAQTLGRRTTNPSALKELVEGKFVDALRAVAAEMAMEELHEKRVDFVQKVQAAVSEDLLKNGMELESVSLTALDQTDRRFFNADNAFDAEGLTKLTEKIEDRRRRRNEIERETEVEIQKKNLDAEQQSLGLERETQYARLQNEKEVEVRRAEQNAEIARERAEREREAKEAEIAARQRVQQAELQAERAVKEDAIANEQKIREREVVREQAVEVAEQDRAIAIAEKSRAQSDAEAAAALARAGAVKAEEEVVTVREAARAERQKRIELVEASKEAEREAIAITLAAEAQRKAEMDRAEATRTQAQATADSARITAEGEAQAELARVEAAKQRYAVEAEGKRALHEADNLLQPAVIDMRIKLELLAHIEGIVRESVRPMEKIDGIKIFQVDGLSGGAQGAARAEAGSGSLADQMVSSALRYRAQAPLLDSLLKEIGLAGGGDPTQLAGALQSIIDSGGVQSVEPAAEVAPVIAAKRAETTA